MKKILLGGTVGVLALILAMPAMASDFQNGSFEKASVNPRSLFTLLDSSSTRIDGWEVNLGSIEYVGSYWEVEDGDRSIDLNGDAQGSIKQKFETDKGATYKVTFYMSGNPDGGPDKKIMRVSATGNAARYFSFDEDNSRSDMDWEKRTYYFKATESDTTLIFASWISGYYGPALDKVSVEKIAKEDDNDEPKKKIDYDYDDICSDNNKDSKACQLWQKGVRGKGILTAPGLQKSFNEKHKAFKKFARKNK